MHIFIKYIHILKQTTKFTVISNSISVRHAFGGKHQITWLPWLKPRAFDFLPGAEGRRMLVLSVWLKGLTSASSLGSCNGWTPPLLSSSLQFNRWRRGRDSLYQAGPADFCISHGPNLGHMATSAQLATKEKGSDSGGRVHWPTVPAIESTMEEIYTG